MEFFRELSRVGTGFKKISITIMENGGNMTVAFLPETKSDSVNGKLIPVSMTGTPMEVDEGFFPNIIKAVDKINGLTTNLDQVEKKVEEAGQELAKEKKPAKKNPTDKPKAKSKVENKKPVEKTSGKPITKPEVEAGAEEEPSEQNELTF